MTGDNGGKSPRSIVIRYLSDDDRFTGAHQWQRSRKIFMV